MRRRIPSKEFDLYSWKVKKREAHLGVPKNESRLPVWAVFGYRIIFRLYTSRGHALKEKLKKVTWRGCLFYGALTEPPR